MNLTLKPGTAAKFSEYDIVKALFKLEVRPYGRNKLMQVLGLSEASTRSLMRKLKALKYAKSSTRGLVLSEKGAVFVAGLKKKISDPIVVENFEKNSIAFKLKNASGKVKIGIEQRDAAVRAGASGALVLVYSKGTLTMPGVRGLKKENAKLFAELAEKLGLVEGDAIIVAFSPPKISAGKGAWAAAKSLL